jgi:hypothetical protein
VKNTDIEFDYSDADTPDEVVRSVAAEMSGGRLNPLSEDERLERERWREELRRRDEERQAEQEYRQAVADEAARQELADEIAERNRQWRLQQQREYQERAERRSRNLDLSALKLEAQQAASWRNVVQASIRQQHVQSLYGELEKMLTPPAPPAEPEVTIVYGQYEGSSRLGDPDFNPDLWKKI